MKKAFGICASTLLSVSFQAFGMIEADKCYYEMPHGDLCGMFPVDETNAAEDIKPFSEFKEEFTNPICRDFLDAFVNDNEYSDIVRLAENLGDDDEALRCKVLFMCCGKLIYAYHKELRENIEAVFRTIPESILCPEYFGWYSDILYRMALDLNKRGVYVRSVLLGTISQEISYGRRKRSYYVETTYHSDILKIGGKLPNYLESKYSGLPEPAVKFPFSYSYPPRLNQYEGISVDEALERRRKWQEELREKDPLERLIYDISVGFRNTELARDIKILRDNGRKFSLDEIDQIRQFVEREEQRAAEEEEEEEEVVFNNVMLRLREADEFVHYEERLWGKVVFLDLKK
ncbi:MAG: hypothetical protein LBO73_03925 [Holosporaceae bacterium]|jgi:hypothetical protein|nr:hypothetical protein [Holosporaceae bacterium]